MPNQLISQLTVLTSKTGRATTGGCFEIPGVIELGIGKNGERRLSCVTRGGGHNNPFYLATTSCNINIMPSSNPNHS